jgi:hypothetical protein
VISFKLGRWSKLLIHQQIENKTKVEGAQLRGIQEADAGAKSDASNGGT